MTFAILEWLTVTKQYLMFKIKNSFELNQLDKIASGILYVKISNTDSKILNGKHISKTYLSTDCKYRYFSIESDTEINIPRFKGVVDIISSELGLI
jgi:hypothetical protein